MRLADPLECFARRPNTRRRRIIVSTTFATTLPFGLQDLPLFLLLPALLVASGFFSGSETALFCLSSQNRMRLIRGQGLIARVTGSLLSDMQLLLITLMFGNMTINVLYFVISSALLLKLDPSQHAAWIAVGSVLPLIMIIIFGEVLPKMIANLVPVPWVRVTAVPLFTVHRLIGPLRVALRTWIIAPLGRLFAPSHQPAALSADELHTLVEVSRHAGVIDVGEQRMLREVVHLSQLKVRDIMVPRVDVATFEITGEADALHRLIQRTRVSKVPVYEGDIDHMVGVIYTRQFLLARAGPGPVDLRRLVRQVRYVPELQRVDQLLAEFRKSGTQLAIVVDEYGGTAGLVTIKDVVERLVGELDFDPSETDENQTEDEATAVAPGVWRVSGRLSAADWAGALGTADLPRRVSTVGGLITALLGRLPRVGDRVRLGNLVMRVEQVQRGRVETATLQLADAAPDAAEGRSS